MSEVRVQNHYDVHPRYTPGSPAMLTDSVQAERIATSERNAYLDAVSWSMHPDYQKAKDEGLQWIVFEVWEHHGFVHHRCLLTDARRQTPAHLMNTPTPEPRAAPPVIHAKARNCDVRPNGAEAVAAFSQAQRYQAALLTAQGYRRVSNRYGSVARIDRPDWVEVLAAHMRKSVANYYDAANPTRIDPTWADHYRRVHSKDIINLQPPMLARLVPGSNFDDTGYVPKDGEQLPEPTFFHEIDHDGVCVRCNFDGAEWWHINKGLHVNDRAPYPSCINYVAEVSR